MRSKRWVLGALIVVVGMPLALALAAVAWMAVAPLSLMALAPTVQEHIWESLHYAYRPEFDDLSVRLSGEKDGLALVVALEGVRAYDFSEEEIASLPRVEAALPVAGIVGGSMSPSRITVSGAKARWIETVGGAVKFDIGAAEPGASGKILEDFLITIASSPESSSPSQAAFPAIEIAHSDLYFQQDATGLSAQFTDVEFTANPTAKGVASRFSLALSTSGGLVPISGETSFSTAGELIDVSLEFDGLRPADTGIDLPPIVPSGLWTRALDGEVHLEMDKLFRLETLDMSLRGDGLDLAVRGAKGANDFGLEIEASVTDLDRTTAADGHWLATWLPQTGAWLADSYTGAVPLRLRLGGTVARFDDQVDLLLCLGPPESAYSVAGATESPTITPTPGGCEGPSRPEPTQGLRRPTPPAHHRA